MRVSLVSATPDAEAIMAYCARASSTWQKNPTYERLFAHCLLAKKPHWSVFEMADMTLEIETSRAISAQIIRHRSFNFQEFSQRYAKVHSNEPIQLRYQDLKDRQSSLLDPDNLLGNQFSLDIDWLLDQANLLYQEMIEAGVAKECARMILPMASTTRLYMKGSVRSWIHYLQVRLDPSTQLEHQQLAQEAQKIFVQTFPTVSKILGWELSSEPTTNNVLELTDKAESLVENR